MRSRRQLKRKSNQDHSQKGENETEGANSPKAIVMAYTKILRKVKADSDVKNSKEGDFMFELKNPGRKKIYGFFNEIKKSFGENIAVRAQVHKNYIQCKELDELTSRGKTCTALKEQFKLEEWVKNPLRV